MTDEAAIEIIKDALREVVSGRDAEITEIDVDMKIRDLGIDSVASMEMVGCVEERLGTRFPDDSLAQLERFRDLVDLIHRST